MATDNRAAVAEKSLIGSVLIDDRTLALVREIVRADDFYSQMNRDIYAAMCALDDAGMPINLATLFSRLLPDPTFANNNGELYLTQCMQELPSAQNVETFAKIVRGESVRRKLVGFADKLKATAEGSIADIDETVARLGDELASLPTGGAAVPWITFSDAVHGACATLLSEEVVTVVESGFVDLDAKLTGFRPGALTIIAARPAMGKTAFGLNIMAHAAINDGLPVAFFSLEMTAEELIFRVLSARASVNGNAIRRKQMTQAEWDRLLGAAERYPKPRIYIDETAGIDISTLRDRARRMHRQYGIRLLIVDYLQLMRSTRGRYQNREQEVADISRGLKETAKELHIPVIALAQLNRALDTRADKRPVLSDLRESGSIEQDADNVLFIHREDYYKPNTEPTNEAEIIIAKQRNGPTGNIKLHWEGQYTRFENLSDMRFV